MVDSGRKDKDANDIDLMQVICHDVSQGKLCWLPVLAEPHKGLVMLL